MLNFYHLYPFLRVWLLFAHFWPFLWVQLICEIFIHVYECHSFVPFLARVRLIFSSLDVFTNVTVLRVQLIFGRFCLICTIPSHFYECESFVPFLAVFTSATHFNQFKPFLEVRLICTISSHFYECDSFLPLLAIFTSATHFYHS